MPPGMHRTTAHAAPALFIRSSQAELQNRISGGLIWQQGTTLDGPCYTTAFPAAWPEVRLTTKAHQASIVCHTRSGQAVSPSARCWRLLDLIERTDAEWALPHLGYVCQLMVARRASTGGPHSISSTCRPGQVSQSHIWVQESSPFVIGTMCWTDFAATEHAGLLDLVKPQTAESGPLHCCIFHAGFVVWQSTVACVIRSEDMREACSARQAARAVWWDTRTLPTVRALLFASIFLLPSCVLIDKSVAHAVYVWIQMN